MLSAAVLFERAVEHSNAGRHATARRLLTQASARADGIDLAARIAGTLAYLEAETGDPDRAVRRCRDALASGGISEHTRAVLTSQLGLIELRRGDLDRALPHLDAALAKLTDDPERLGRIVLNRGLVHLERGDIRSADSDFTAAAEAFQSAGDEVELAKAQHNRGYAALIAGDLVLAMTMMDGAREVLAALSPVTRAVCDLDRADVLRAAGMTSEAGALLESVATTFGARRLRKMQADAELVRAHTLVDTDPVLAASVARRASRRYRSRGDDSGALRADACELGASVLAGRRGPALRLRLEQTVTSLERSGLDAEARALTLQGARLDVRAGRLQTAAAALDVDHGDRVTTVLLFHEVAAELEVTVGRRDRAMAMAGRGLDVLGDWQARFGSIDLQSSMAARGRRLALAGIRAALETGDADAVFAWAERTRSLSARIMPTRPPADPVVADRLTELRALRLAGDASERERDLETSIRRSRWSGDGSHAVAELATLTEALEGARSADAEVISYLWSGDRIVALVIGRRVRIVDLGPWTVLRDVLGGLLADLDTAAADLPAQLASVVHDSLHHRLARLDALLVEPLGTIADRVVISPAGALSGLPWSMLPSLRNRRITVPVSTSRWLEQIASPWVLDRVGCVAGPTVARADHEVVAAAAKWPDATVLGSHVSRCEAVSALASSVDVLHLSAHGRHSVENPLFSGIELADGPWFGYDVDQLERVPQVVVLSACEVGRSATDWGREALGMAQSWLHAGSRAVVAAPAGVNDASASELLPAVHASMSAGDAPSDALAKATESSGASSPFLVYGAGW